MKTISKVLCAILFVGTLSLTASASDIKPEKSLSKEIQSFMSNIELPEGPDYQAMVKFLVNENKEIVIVSVDTKDDTIKEIIKGRLNYRKVKSDEAVPNKINQIKLTMKQPDTF